MAESGWVVSGQISDRTSVISDPTKLTFSRVTRSNSEKEKEAGLALTNKPRHRSVSIKRKPACQSKTTVKRANLEMDQNAIAALIDQTTESAIGKIRADMNNLEGKIIEEMKAITIPIEQALNNLTTRQDSHDKRMDELSDKLESLKTNLSSDVKKEILAELNQTKREQLNLFLGNEIEKMASNIILYGYKGEATKESIVSMFGEMGVENMNDLRVVKIAKLGLPKGSGNKVAPIIITLGNTEQRNNVLKSGSKLPTGISMERDMPPAYRTQYKQFKKHAWKLRAMYGVKTQIVFDAHVLILRYKEEGKAFTIVDEFIPPLTSIREKRNKNPPQGAGPASDVIKDKGFNETSACTVILVMNQCVESGEHLYNLIGPHLSERLTRDIRDTKISKANVLLQADSPETASKIAKQLNGVVIEGKKVYAEPFGNEI